MSDRIQNISLNPLDAKRLLRIIGIDLGSVCCGYGVLELRVKSSEFGVKLHNSRPPALPAGRQTQNSELIYITSGEIRMNKKDTLPVRLNLLYSSLKEIINEYKPTHLCIEKIFYHKSIRSAFALGGVRGIAMLLAGENAMPVFEYNSTELKQAVTGYGRAEKIQVGEMVKRILNLNSRVSPDEADALALCICHINSLNWR